VIPRGSDPVGEKLAIVGIGNPPRWIEENGNSSVGSVLVGSLEIETAAEMRAEPAPQIVDRSIGERHIGDALSAALNFVRGPETRVDMYRLEAFGVPCDAYRPVCLHAPILQPAVLIGRLSTAPDRTEDVLLT
jgi:hypothetical protein